LAPLGVQAGGEKELFETRKTVSARKKFARKRGERGGDSGGLKIGEQGKLRNPLTALV